MVIQVTDRDEAMLAWLNVVRMADLEAVKFALAGLAGAGEPVGKRRANQLVARMEKVATEPILARSTKTPSFVSSRRPPLRPANPASCTGPSHW